MDRLYEKTKEKIIEKANELGKLCRGPTIVYNEVIQIPGRSLNIIGDDHFTLSILDHFYQKILPRIHESPFSWYFLKEGNRLSDGYIQQTKSKIPYEVPEDYWNLDPMGAYLLAISNEFGISMANHIEDLQSNKVKDAVISKGLSPDYVDCLIIHFELASRGENKRNEELLERIGKLIGKSKDEVIRVINKRFPDFYLPGFCGIIESSLFNDLIGCWESVNIRNLERLLEDERKRENVLLFQGLAHVNPILRKYRGT
ncbi:hypothetical protein J4466_03060 [Candidatus Pacearchaeota archaeon]|nr:hypothetical protein [Candidatus Pacearchaeota archaeon]